MKKIAVCIYDFYISRNNINIFQRTYYNLLKHVLYNTDFDLFIHIWNNPIKETYVSLNNLLYNIEHDLFKYYEISKNQQELQKKYRLKHIGQINEFYKPEAYKVEFNKHFNSSHSQFHSLDSVLELANDYSRKNNIQYDSFFIVKPNCIFTTNLNLNLLNIQNTLYISNWQKITNLQKQNNINSPDDFNYYGISNLWCFGNTNIINRLRNIKNNIDLQKNIEQNFYTYIVNNNISYTPILFFNDDYYILSEPNNYISELNNSCLINN